MIRWLYQIIFRGIGMVLVIGMITALCLAIILMHRHRAPQHHGRTPTLHASVHRVA
jgi:hypothetical protein